MIHISYGTLDRAEQSRVLNHFYDTSFIKTNAQVRKGDIQMAAIIACIFKPRDVPQRRRAAAPALSVLAPSRPSPLPSITTPWTMDAQTGRQHRLPQPRMHSPAAATAATTQPRPSVPPQRKTSKFWFLKPGALPATVAEGSPYHTIHVATASRDIDGGASPMKSDLRSASTERRKKKTSASSSNAYSASQALLPPPPPPPPGPPLNKARIEKSWLGLVLGLK